MRDSAVEMREVQGGVEISVKVVPNSSRDAVVGVLVGALKVKVAAPAEGGKANRAVCGVLAEVLGVNKGNVEMVAGKSNPNKMVLVRAMSIEEVRERLGVA